MQHHNIARRTICIPVRSKTILHTSVWLKQKNPRRFKSLVCRVLQHRRTRFGLLAAGVLALRFPHTYTYDVRSFVESIHRLCSAVALAQLVVFRDGRDVDGWPSFFFISCPFIVFLFVRFRRPISAGWARAGRDVCGADPLRAGPRATGSCLGLLPRARQVP